MIIASDEELSSIRRAGAALRSVLDAVALQCVAGVSCADLDESARALIEESGCTPAFPGYTPPGGSRPFPAALCVSVNDEVVHGVPHRRKILKDGDVVTIDCGLSRDGLFVDAARTVLVGAGSAEARKLVDATRKALGYALLFAHPDSTTGAIGSAIEEVARDHGLTAPPELGGHGLGASLHEDPFIPNIGGTDGEALREGQVVAIEPIFFSGSDPRIVTDDDGFTVRTLGGGLAAHFEHTVIIRAGAPEIVTGSLW